MARLLRVGAGDLARPGPCLSGRLEKHVHMRHWLSHDENQQILSVGFWSSFAIFWKTEVERLHVYFMREISISFYVRVPLDHPVLFGP